MDKQQAIITKSILKHHSINNDKIDDHIAVEEPLEISITALRCVPPVTNKNISITMRTPGDDVALAIGFLYTEGIIRYDDTMTHSSETDNQITIELPDRADLDLSKIERHFYTSSSCGVCGKSSIEAIWTQCPIEMPAEALSVHSHIIKNIPTTLSQSQSVFQQTGGLHAAALYTIDGDIIDIKEDVGRHNALDKLIGAAILRKTLPLHNNLLLLSGRVSFELVQKSAMAGIRMIMAIGAPSSLAIQLAEEFDITLIGFLGRERFNVYHGAERIIF